VWRLVQYPLLKAAEIVTRGDYPILIVSNMHDIALGGNAVSSSIALNAKVHHAALTGPNGGGKSSFMRALLQGVLISHAYGLAPADRFLVRRFNWISSGLRLQDRPGDLSFFETEVFFASDILKKDAGIGLVLYDELFHSTNPPDGIRTAELFLKQLWNMPSVISVVSTHVFDLVESAPPVVKKICCNAKKVGDRIAFSYEVVPGVSKISSVTEIWNRFGLDASVVA
jgi:DNA mismatch repair protein MutS